MTTAHINWLMSPWPQWRTHWRVWHAWPLGAQALLLSVCSLLAMFAGSVWVSAQAWDSWWQSQDRAQQTQQDMQLLQQQVQQQRTRIANMQAMLHPAGFALPAWQTWPDDMPPDNKQVLRAWLAWGRQHGLKVQAGKIEEAAASGSWTGSLPQLLAAWHGLPAAVPRMAVTAFEWRIQPDPLRTQTLGKTQALQLHMHWVLLKERNRPPEKASKPQALVTPNKEGETPANLMTPNPAPSTSRTSSASLMHNPFSMAGMKKALPMVALSGATPLPWQTRPLAQMRWAGMLANDQQRQALVHCEGRVHPVLVGDHLGQDWGVVMEIGRDHLRLREWVADAQGKWVSLERRFPAGAQP